MEKTLSIIIAAYNVEKYLEKAITTCILSEEYRKDYEIIVVNDGSSDSTEEICLKMKEKYPDVLKIINKTNGGYGSVINVGIEKAEGKYFKILDGDDWVKTENLILLIESLKLTSADMVLTDFDYVDDRDGNVRRQSFRNNIKPKEEVPLEGIKVDSKNDGFSMHAIFFKTGLLKDNNIKIREKCFYTDTEYILYAISFVNKVIYYDLCIYQYRIGLQGQSVSLEGIKKHINDMENVIKDLNTYFAPNKKTKNEYFINTQLAKLYKTYIGSLLLFPVSTKIKKQIKEFDIQIRKKCFNRYELMENRKILLLRMSKYHLYRFCAWYAKREKSKNGL